jgi:hypothetical protein
MNFAKKSNIETQMNKETMLNEMRRVAKELGTDTLGKTNFANMSGITEGRWLGKFWASWSDAVNEAGLKPGFMNGAHDKELLLESLAALTQKLGRFPTAPELKMEKIINFLGSRIMCSVIAVHRIILCVSATSSRSRSISSAQRHHQ